jgi:transcriptional regulator with XRE-family HTH domain
MGRKRAKTEWEESMSARLKQMREAAGMTQAAVAQAAGVPLRTYQTWEQGVRTPLIDAAAKVAEALDISLDDLAGIGPPPRKRRRAPKEKDRTKPTEN